MARNPRNTPKRILVIDDDIYVARIVALCLEPFGEFDVQAALDGPSGVQEAVHHKPDLIVLDFDLPGADGLAVLQRLREAAATQAIPIVAVTGAMDVDPRCIAMVSACDAYVAKPVNFRILRQTTLNLLLRAAPTPV